MHNYFLFLLYGGAPIVTQLLLYSPIISYSLYGCAPIVTQSPIISYSLILILHHLQWSVRRTLECEQTLKIFLIKVYYYLAGRFDSILLIEQL